MITEIKELEQKTKQQQENLKKRVDGALEQFEKYLNTNVQPNTTEVQDVLNVDMVDYFYQQSSLGDGDVDKLTKILVEEILKAGYIESINVIDGHIFVALKPPYTDFYLKPCLVDEGERIEIRKLIVCSKEVEEFIQEILKKYKNR